jgi:uncharacterized protein (TIGR02757 family)
MPFRHKSPGAEYSLKEILNRFYREYNFQERLKYDPIEFPRRYFSPRDIEIAGFIASCFAYGKVELFKPVIEKILAPCGKHPAQFLKNFSLKSDSKYFKNITYRFNKEEDILCLMYMLGMALRKWGSLKNLFYYHFNPAHEDIRYALENFVDFLLNTDTTIIYGKNIKPRGIVQFFPNPKKGSACKRLNLFLRWMVRTKDIDLGIWDKIPASKLIIPLDTHITKISRCLGLTKRASSDWKTAKEITNSLKELEPKDPLKYDFALCHQGISGLCKGEKLKNICAGCSIKK